jgi:rhodanese-related sulfurtransferase
VSGSARFVLGGEVSRPRGAGYVNPSLELPFDIPAARVASLLASGEVQLVDVREPYERAAGFVEGSRHVPLAELTAAAASIDPALPVVFVCRVGARSSMAAWSFARAGYDAHNLTGGMVAWEAGGLPLAPDGGYVADH